MGISIVIGPTKCPIRKLNCQKKFGSARKTLAIRSVRFPISFRVEYIFQTALDVYKKTVGRQEVTSM